MTYSSCVLRWSCEDDARVTLNGVLFDESDSGVVAYPERGVYRLERWDGSAWVLQKQLTIDAPMECGFLTSRSCCRELTGDGSAWGGNYARPTIGTINGFSALMSAINGTYVLDLVLRPIDQPCHHYFVVNYSIDLNATAPSNLLYEEYQTPTFRYRVYLASISVYGGPVHSQSPPYPKKTVAAGGGSLQVQYELKDHLGVPGWSIDRSVQASPFTGQITRGVGGEADRCSVGSGYIQGNVAKYVAKANQYFSLPAADVLIVDAGPAIVSVEP